ncbi:MAG: hypothetical protein PVI87_02845 [Gammaproteobacteria bacterium]|jgi:hypothetical protein
MDRTTEPHRRRAGRFAAVWLALLAAGCGGGGGGGGGSQTLQLLADGTGSTTGVVGQPVGQVPGVRVVDGRGAGVSGVTVTFRVGEAGASVSPAAVTTGGDGRARPASWVLGTQAGSYSLIATAQGASGEARFTATAAAGSPAALVAASAQQQVGEAGQPVPEPPAVRVTDAFDNPVAAIVVSFAVVQGNGSVSSESASSDSDGIARLQSWTLGGEGGVNEVSATLAGVGSVDFSATAEGDGGGSEVLELLADANGSVTGVVGQPVDEVPVVRVVDGNGDAVAGVAVSFRADPADASVSPATVATGADGRAQPGSWVLGTRAGQNFLTVSLEGASGELLFTVNAEPGPPGSLTPASAQQQGGVVGQPVAEPPAVLVTDSFGNALAGVVVDFAVVQGGGSIEGETATSDADGVARLQSWTLGAEEGLNEVTATLAGVGSVTFTANTEVAAPAALVAASAQEQTGDAGQPVAEPPAVRVTDALGNPVPGVVVDFAVVQGGGSIVGETATSDADGIAQLQSWTLGDQEGLNEVTATLVGVGSVSFTAEGLPPLELSIEAVHLNQATQTLAGDIAAVAGREGLLRVVVTASRSNTARPDVRVRLFQDGVQLWERILPARAGSVLQEPFLSSLNLTWNIELTPEEVQPGLAVEAVVDPAGEINLASRENTRFPRGSGQAPIEVRELAPMRVLFIPVQATRHNDTGGIFPGNVDDFLTNTRLWLPVGNIEREVRATPFVTDRDLTSLSDIQGLLSDLQALRTAESAGDRYYHGIVPNVQGMPVAGIAFRPSSPSSTFRTGLSYDNLPRAAETVAHELTHNLGRRHSPCGNNISGVDPAFPYADGGIGEAGYHIEDDSLRGPSGYFDYMGYCRPRWTSDYTYEAALDWRATDPLAAVGDAGMLAEDVPETSGVLLWGRMDSEGVELNPAFQLEARPLLPEADGPNQLRGVADDGEVLFDLSFAGEAVPHAADPAERQFAWFVPLSPAQLSALDRVELIAPQGVALHSARGGPLGGAPEPATQTGEAAPSGERLPDGSFRLTWDTARSPVALLRDSRSGQIVGIGRGGELRIDAATSAMIEPELVLSDGVRTRRAAPFELPR